MTSEPAHPFGGKTRYHCPVSDCVWHHDEQHGLERVGPVRLPLVLTPDDVGHAISAMAGQIAIEKASQVEAVLREHLARSHPGVLEGTVPIAVMDAQDLAQGTPALQHRLDWLRSEGIDPDTTRRVEVYLEEDGLYAEVTSFGRDDRVHEATAVGGEPVVSKRRQGVSSVPPAEAAANTLNARVTGKP